MPRRNLRVRILRQLQYPIKKRFFQRFEHFSIKGLTLPFENGLNTDRSNPTSSPSRSGTHYKRFAEYFRFVHVLNCGQWPIVVCNVVVFMK